MQVIQGVNCIKLSAFGNMSLRLVVSLYKLYHCVRRREEEQQSAWTAGQSLVLPATRAVIRQLICLPCAPHVRCLRVLSTFIAYVPELPSKRGVALFGTSGARRGSQNAFLCRGFGPGQDG